MNANHSPIDEAIAFLRLLDPDGRHNLVAIDPNTRDVAGITIEPGDWPAARSFVAAHNGRRNVYVSMNEPRPGAPHDKLGKDQIASIRCVYADLDPAGERPFDDERRDLLRKVDTLRHSATPPTVTIDSGGGFQFVWLLDGKRDVADETFGRQWAEDQGRALRRMIGGDAVQNIDRIMRLPGTTNIPDAKKRAKGRTERPAAILHETGRRWKPSEIATNIAPLPKAEADSDTDAEIQATIDALDMSGVCSAASFTDLPDDLRRRFVAAAERDGVLAALWHGAAPSGADHSGSAYRGALAARLGRIGGFNAEDFGRLAWVWPHSVQAGDDRDEKITARSIARDWCRLGRPLSAEVLAAKFFRPIENYAPLFGDDFSKPIFDPLVPSARRFTFTSLTEAAATALTDSAKPLIKGLLDQGAMTVLYGESNSGKTFVALDIAWHIAAGREWNGRRVAPGGVVYVAAEGGGGARKRAAALMARHGAGDVPFLFLLSPVNLLRADADLEPLIMSIREAAAGGGWQTALVVIDTLSRAMSGGDENTSTDMGAMVRHLDALRAATDSHLMVVHHSGKDRARGARGHSLLRAATDTEIEIADRMLTVTKQRDIDGSLSLGFALRNVVLGVDEEGDVVSSAVVDWAAPGVGDGAEAGAVLPDPTEREAMILEAIAALTDGANGSGGSAGTIAGVTAKDVSDIMSAEGGTLTLNNAKYYLVKMAAKGLIQRLGRGKFGLSVAYLAKNGRDPLSTFSYETNSPFE